WMTSDNQSKIDDFIRRKAQYIATDKDGNYVFLAQSAFLLQSAQQDFPDITFHTTSEFKRAMV
ncbi:MAG TPA: peptide chain release factor 3, partial [Vicingus sp.]|nr:peptide chain release factor 3 [Vicingus sp.]